MNLDIYSMKKVKVSCESTIYISPAMAEVAVDHEGVLCISGSHDPFKEDDSWIDFLE